MAAKAKRESDYEKEQHRASKSVLHMGLRTIGVDQFTIGTWLNIASAATRVHQRLEQPVFPCCGEQVASNGLCIRAPKLLEDIRSAADFVKTATDGVALHQFKQDCLLQIGMRWCMPGSF